MNQEVFLGRSPSEEVIEHFPTPISPSPVDYSKMIAILAAWRDILNTRLLAIIAVIGALFMFCFAMYDPSNLRITAACLYCMGVLWPIIALYLRKG